MSVNINVLKEIHKNHTEETDIKIKKNRRNLTDTGMYLPKKGALRVHLNINPKELEEIMLVCHSCDNKSTKEDTIRIHKGVKHKAKLSNCDKCE